MRPEWKECSIIYFPTEYPLPHCEQCNKETTIRYRRELGDSIPWLCFECWYGIRYSTR